MRSVKLRTSDKKKVQEKLDLVIEKLMNLGGPENGEELAEGGEAIGFFKRDFGIREWDWPQGVGLYGLLRIMQARKNEDYKEFLYQWFKDNIREGLPSKNINTTTPLLTLAELNEYYHDQEFETLCLKWADWLMNCLPRTREGGFQHVTSANGDRQGVRLNENEMWIDTIFMTVLFLNRMWHTVLTDAGSYEEVSGSAAITAGILKGIRYGILDDSYLACAWKAVEAILDNIDRDGTVLNVSGGTGMGYDADHYKNILIAPMAYGQSLTILALAEALLHLD